MRQIFDTHGTRLMVGADVADDASDMATVEWCWSRGGG